MVLGSKNYEEDFNEWERRKYPGHEKMKYAIKNYESKIKVNDWKYNNVLGSASMFTPLHLFNAKLKKGASADFSFPSNFNTALLVIEGSITVNHHEKAPSYKLVLMANDGETFSVQATEDAIVLILSGEPINEPIAAHGPFVMNTREELIQAFEDFNKGKFGYLED